VTEPGDLDTQDVSARDEELWLPLIQSLNKFSGQVADSIISRNNVYSIQDRNKKCAEMRKPHIA